MEESIRKIVGKNYDTDSLVDWLWDHNSSMQIYGNIIPGRGKLWVLRM